MITLYTLPPAFGERCPSPFCLKAEMALTYLKLDFETKTTLELNKAPKGKAPWLADNLHGLGRHTMTEQRAFARRDLDALEAQVSANGYIASKRMTACDFAVASMLAAMMDNQPPTWISAMANEMQPLRDYAERVQGEVGVYCRPVTKESAS